MKKLVLGLLLAFTLFSYRDIQAQVVVSSSVNLGDNLDLQELGELVKDSRNAQNIERELNQNGSINNLDLNNDGNVDYITVTEYGNGNSKGFSFTVDLGNRKQEVATIVINRENGYATMNIQGDQRLYGQSAYYQSNYSLSELLIMSYLFSYHTPYYSPYRYGYYPTYYHSYRYVPVHQYQSRYHGKHRTFVRTSNYHPRIGSPNSHYGTRIIRTNSHPYTRSYNAPKATRSYSTPRPTRSYSTPNRRSYGGSSYRSSSHSSSRSHR